MGTKVKNWGRFAEVDRENRYRLIWGSQGKGGSGKTHFGLTAPDPIAVMLFDPKGLEGLTRQDAFKDKEIKVIEYNFNPSRYDTEKEKADAALEQLEMFIEDYQIALVNARTILWDKEDHVWETLRYARNGDFSAAPASYHELNLQYRGWFQDAADAGVNLGVIRGMKEQWGTRQKINRDGRPVDQPFATGKYIPRGQNEVPELVQIYLDHRWDAEKKAFITRIGSEDNEKCRVGAAAELLGEEYDNLDFATLALLLYPETLDTPEVWA